jgi:hypothetical protein
MNKVETLVILGLVFNSLDYAETGELQEYLGEEFMNKLDATVDEALTVQVEGMSNPQFFEVIKNLIQNNVFGKD